MNLIGLMVENCKENKYSCNSWGVKRVLLSTRNCLKFCEFIRLKQRCRKMRIALILIVFIWFPCVATAAGEDLTGKAYCTTA